MSADDIINAQRARGAKAGREWAEQQPEVIERIEIIAEADRRWPYESADFIAAYNLSGGFIDGATEQFKGRET